MDMLKYLKSKIPAGGQHDVRTKDRAEFFKFAKTVQHGFPSKASCIATDNELSLLAIETSTGYLKIYGAPGVEFIGHHGQDKSVRELSFLPNQGRIVSLCEDGTFHLWEINFKADHGSTLDHVLSCETEGKIKKISCCTLRQNGDELHVLIGTEGGNVYQLDTKTFDLTDSIIYQDAVIQNTPDDYKLNPGAVEALALCPTDPNQLLLGYNRGLIVVWDATVSSARQICVCSQQVESISWHSGGQKFMSAHNDGSYVVWNSADCSKPDMAPNIPYGPFPCKPISKILWKTTASDDEDYIIFAGGMPRAAYGDRNTITVLHKRKQVVFDFSSRIIDFCTLDAYAADSDIQDPHTLFVLCEEELVTIDLLSDDWLTFQPPYLHSVHASSMTSACHVANVPKNMWENLI